MSPSVDASTTKVTSIRHVHNIQYGYICPVETPEGGKIGLIKNLAIMATVTHNMNSQILPIKNLIDDYIIEITDIDPEMFHKLFKVFINGEWLGFCEEEIKLYNLLKHNRTIGNINKYVSIILNIRDMELKILCDEGRITRPLLIVNNNNLILTKKMLDNIDIDNIDNSKINKWNTFLDKYPETIEYVDVEESENTMIAMYTNDLHQNKKLMNKYKKPDPSGHGNRVNRYDDTIYVKYSHCEFDPNMMLGTTSSNIPFCEHNQGPRNIYNFSQSRQAKGIYATNHRYRMDISYLLAHPYVPLVQTRSMRYLNTIDLPAGENCCVAIACYSGYNQEDSVVMNQTAIDRGLFRSWVMKKESDEIKNPNTSQDDVFMKPDNSKVICVKDGNYSKLNEKGFVPEETPIENGDVIIGKVSPIQPDGNRIYKDSSKIYKSGVPGIIDKVETGIYNNDGFEMYAVRIRSERTPRIGDKFCSRHGQKGTIGITLPAADMPFTKRGNQPDIIINPNCIPSRMTIGQLLECVLGKVSALEGHFSDATPFKKFDIEKAMEILRKHGFDDKGYEELYCGMTGKK